MNNPNYLIIDKNKYSLIDIHKIDKNISENIENNSIESINEAKNIIKILIFKDKKFVIIDDIYIGTRYIKILQTIKYYRNLLNFNINIDNIISYQKKLIELKLKNISLKFNNFYTKDNVKAFLNELTNKFNKDYIGQQYYEYIKPNDLPIKKYELKSIIKEQDNSNNSSNSHTYNGAGLGLNLERKNNVENGSTNHNNSNNSSISNNNQFESKKNTTQLNKKIYTRLYNSNNNQSNINNNQSNSKKNTTQINKKMYTRLYNSNNNQSNSNNNQSNSNNNQSNSKKKNNTNQNDEYKQNKIILIS